MTTTVSRSTPRNGGQPVRVVIKFAGSRIPAFYISRVCDAVERTVFDHEWAVLQSLRQDNDPQISVGIDAAILRLEERAGTSVTFDGAERGSILLTGIVAGLAIYLVDKTVGASIGEAWKTTAAHSKIKQALSIDVVEFARELQRAVRLRSSSVFRRGRIRPTSLPPKVDVTANEETNVVTVVVEEDPASRTDEVA